MRGINYIVWHDLTLLFQWSISANQYRGSSDYPMMKPLFKDGSTPSNSAQETLNDSLRMKMMGIICYGLHSRQISTQLISSRRCWTDASDSALYYHHQDTTWGNLFWKNSVPPSSTVPETCKIYSMPRSIKNILVPQNNINTLFFFSIIYCQLWSLALLSNF